MNKKLLKRTISATFAALATVAVGAEQALPTPPPSPYPDTESSICAAVTNWPGLGRHVKLTFSANFTPSNCVQIALGQDTDSDGDLAPEETHLVLGVDCGEPFIRNEVKVRGEGEQWNVQISSAETEQEPNLDCSPSPSPSTFTLPTPSTFTFAFKQPSAVAKRVTHVKVTTRGRDVTAAEIAAKVTRPGAALILR